MKNKKFVDLTKSLGERAFCFYDTVNKEVIPSDSKNIFFSVNEFMALSKGINLKHYKPYFDLIPDNWKQKGTYKKIETPTSNIIVEVELQTENGCNPYEDEYTLSLIGFVSGSLNINQIGGYDDITLIKDAIQENLNDFKFPIEGHVNVVLMKVITTNFYFSHYEIVSHESFCHNEERYWD